MPRHPYLVPNKKRIERLHARALQATPRREARVRRRRILFAIPALDRGGPDRVFFDLIRGLDRRRFEPILVTSSGEGRYLTLLPDDVAVHLLRPRRGVYGRYPVFDLAAAVRRLRPDVVMTTLRMNMTALVAKPLFLRCVPLVIRQNNQFSTNVQELITRAPLKQRLARTLSLRSLRQADLIVCQSEDMRADLLQMVGGGPDMVVIGNPIDIGWIEARAREETVALAGQPSLVSVGRLMPQKGYDILLRALALVLTAHPRAHLTLIGEGPDRAALEALAGELGLSGAVTFAGFRTNPYPYLRAGDLFVSSSRYEGLPNVILEALACGTPVVATDCPGATRELIEDGRTGWLVPSESPVALATGIQRGLSGIPLDKSALQRSCRERFSLERITSLYQDLFAKLAPLDGAMAPAEGSP